jgi:hypothetical protein
MQSQQRRKPLVLRHRRAFERSRGIEAVNISRYRAVNLGSATDNSTRQESNITLSGVTPPLRFALDAAPRTRHLALLSMPQASCERLRQGLDVRFLNHAVVLARNEMDVDSRRNAAPAAVALRRGRNRRVRWA